MRKAVELMPVDGNGTSHVVKASYLLAVTLSIGKDTNKMEEALEICDNGLRRDPMYTPLFVARYYYVIVQCTVLSPLTHTTVR